MKYVLTSILMLSICSVGLAKSRPMQEPSNKKDTLKLVKKQLELIGKTTNHRSEEQHLAHNKHQQDSKDNKSKTSAN